MMRISRVARKMHFSQFRALYTFYPQSEMDAGPLGTDSLIHIYIRGFHKRESHYLIGQHELDSMSVHGYTDL